MTALPAPSFAPASAPSSTSSSRLREVDALRGIAAVLVMLFHYTTRYEQLYGHNSEPLFALPWGHYGVNLFFCISGFVIFLTLARTARSMDFVVSRFSRLYPAYWVAVLLTFALTHLLGLPGKEVDVANAALNALMFQSLLFVPDVDAVYWTLVVELIFYVWAFAFFVSGQLRRVPLALALVLLLRIAAPHLPQWFGFELPWRASSLLILPYIPWFACGIAVYKLHAGENKIVSLGLIALATLSLVQDSWPSVVLPTVLAPALSLVLFLAASGHLAWLRTRVAVWFGAISYTLYLLHENIGWAVMRRLEQMNVAAPVAIACAIVLTLILAELLRRWVEQPAMRWLRTRYKQSQQVDVPTASHRGQLVGAVLLILIAAVAWATRPAPHTSTQQLALQAPRAEQAVDCALVRAQQPLVLLILGQSNAGNHGTPGDANPDTSPSSQLFVLHQGKCYQSHDPLPGATGAGASIWSALPDALAQQGMQRPLAISLVAVESSTIQNWTEYGPLTSALQEQLSTLHETGMTPALVLWQQGEADARLSTTSSVYLHRLQRLVSTLRSGGVASSILLARSTVCANGPDAAPYPAVYAAQDEASRTLPGVFIGPNTDLLHGAERVNDCHFSSSGVHQAAQLWAASIQTHLMAAHSESSTKPIEP